MTTFATLHTRMAAVALRISASSALPLAPPKAAPCVLDLLGHDRPRAHMVAKVVI
jgi:hypothetical protein